MGVDGVCICLCERCVSEFMWVCVCVRAVIMPVCVMCVVCVKLCVYGVRRVCV